MKNINIIELVASLLTIIVLGFSLVFLWGMFGELLKPFAGVATNWGSVLSYFAGFILSGCSGVGLISTAVEK